MEEIVLWAVVIGGLVVGTPIAAVAVHHRMERRHTKAMGKRRTDKIKL